MSTDLGKALVELFLKKSTTALLNRLGDDYERTGDTSISLVEFRTNARAKALKDIRESTLVEDITVVMVGNVRSHLLHVAGGNEYIRLYPLRGKGVSIELIPRSKRDELIIAHNRELERELERKLLRESGLAKLTVAEQRALGLR